jgi:hypothetical protein
MIYLSVQTLEDGRMGRECPLCDQLVVLGKPETQCAHFVAVDDTIAPNGHLKFNYR